MNSEKREGGRMKETNQSISSYCDTPEEKEIYKLESEIARYKIAVKDLKARINELEEQINKQANCICARDIV